MSDKAPPKLEKPFTNRIVGHEVVAVDQLLANPYNARLHPRNQQSALAGSIDEVGYIRSVTVNQRTGHVVDGHARVTMLLRSGVEAIPVEYVDLTEDEEAKALLLLDPISAMAETDKGKMLDLLNMVNSDDERIQQALSDIAAANKIDFGGGDEKDAEPQVDRAEELRVKWGVELGQMWRMASRDGKRSHYLICGDCTDKDVVARVMGGERADLCVTSPPYAVGKEYEAETTIEQHYKLLRGFADRAIEIVKPGGFIFTNFGEIAPLSHAGPLTGSDRQCIYPISKDYWQIFHEECRCELYAQRIWYKPFNRLQQPFWSYKTSIPHHQEWEHIWTWRTPGGEGDECHDWDISVHAVWDTRNEATGDKPLTRHTAAFPVCLPERAIRAHSKTEATIYEPFSGSGTTIIAAENLSRQCRAVELSAGYCAVSLERYAQAFGITPELVELSG